MTETKRHDWNHDNASEVSGLKAMMPLNRQLAAWHRVEITEIHKETEVGVGSCGKGTSLTGGRRRRRRV